jgi:hypothetical protein
MFLIGMAMAHRRGAGLQAAATACSSLVTKFSIGDPGSHGILVDEASARRLAGATARLCKGPAHSREQKAVGRK